MQLISWNVNGLRTCMGKGFADFFRSRQADIVCLQETKMQPGQMEVDFPGYHLYWNSAQKKGYSGTAVFTRREPLRVYNGIGLPEADSEGRVITLEFPDLALVTVYTPNSQKELARLPLRMAFEDAFRDYLTALAARLPVVVCGDMNVARSPIDLKNPGPNEGSAGYSEPERAKMEQLLQSGFIDTFRMLYPDREGAYTWWSYLYQARSRNAGWRIDYFLVSESLRSRVEDSIILSDVQGSDHCPIQLLLADAG